MAEQYYRTFLTQPYANPQLGRGKCKHGGKVTRNGAPLSGNANSRVMYGTPRGGATDRYMPKFFDGYKIGGRKHFGGLSIDSYINPNTFRHTYPNIGTTIY